MEPGDVAVYSENGIDAAPDGTVSMWQDLTGRFAVQAIGQKKPKAVTIATRKGPRRCVAFPGGLARAVPWEFQTAYIIAVIAARGPSPGPDARVATALVTRPAKDPNDEVYRNYQGPSILENSVGRRTNLTDPFPATGKFAMRTQAYHQSGVDDTKEATGVDLTGQHVVGIQLKEGGRPYLYVDTDTDLGTNGSGMGPQSSATLVFGQGDLIADNSPSAMNAALCKVIVHSGGENPGARIAALYEEYR
jgi:hypothetical protein